MHTPFLLILYYFKVAVVVDVTYNGGMSVVDVS